MAETGAQKAFEAAGVFWLPGSEIRLSGHLKFTADGELRLTLVGKFGTGLFGDYSVIHGALDDELCTLFNCITSQVKSGVIHQLAFAPNLVVIGEHLASLDECRFNGLKIRFQGLNDWVNFGAFAMTHSNAQNFAAPMRIDFSAQKPMITTLHGLCCTVSLGGQSVGSYSHRKTNWEYHNYFEVNFEKPIDVQKLIEVAFDLQHFFALLTWSRSAIKYFSAYRSVPITDSHSGKKQSGIYGHWPVGADNLQSSDIFLTTLNDVSDEFSDLIGSWFKASPGIKTTRKLFTSIIKSEGQYLEFTFLALMQVSEALHRSLDSRSYMKPQDYEPVKNALKMAIPTIVGADHRASLESRIRYGNELSLRTRLKELFLKLPATLVQLVTNDWKSFISRVVDARNALTHPNTDPKTQKLKDQALFDFSQSMKLLLTILLLNGKRQP
jgi:hypothetical protein